MPISWAEIVAGSYRKETDWFTQQKQSRKIGQFGSHYQKLDLFI